MQDDFNLVPGILGLILIKAPASTGTHLDPDCLQGFDEHGSGWHGFPKNPFNLIELNQV